MPPFPFIKLRAPSPCLTTSPVDQVREESRLTRESLQGISQVPFVQQPRCLHNHQAQAGPTGDSQDHAIQEGRKVGTPQNSPLQRRGGGSGAGRHCHLLAGLATARLLLAAGPGPIDSHSFGSSPAPWTGLRERPGHFSRRTSANDYVAPGAFHYLHLFSLLPRCTSICVSPCRGLSSHTTPGPFPSRPPLQSCLSPAPSAVSGFNDPRIPESSPRKSRALVV